MSGPIVAITMGDAAGVGPEIIMKALGDPAIYELSRPVVIGDAKILARAGNILKSGLNLRAIGKIADAVFQPRTVDCLDLDLLPVDLPFGKISAVAGDAAFRFIEKAVELAKAGEIQAICTAPINKEALHRGGHPYPGHTEILADLTGTKDFAMMICAPQVRAIHVTGHVGLLDAIRMITPERVYRVIRMAHDMLQRAGYPSPKIGVCGINPHAGEGGLFGYGEEATKIFPAVERAQEEGIEVAGPLPADTLFFRATRGDFDVVVAMYHDQGHGPVKALGFEKGVNVTVGLPIIRTSVDHGTAFDIAGTGKADESSLKEAIRQAAALAQARHCSRA